MSWKGIKKAIDRGATTIMQQAGAVDKTHDTQFEQEERRLKSLEQTIHKLNRNAGSFINTLRATILSQTRISENIKELGDEGSGAQSVTRYHDITVRLDEALKGQFDEGVRKTVTIPIEAFNLHFTEINKLLNRRKKKLLDYDSARSKVRSKVEKPSADQAEVPRLEQQAEFARQSYEAVNDRLKTEIPQFIDLRQPYLDPSFNALVSWQYRLGQEGSALYDSAKHAILQPNLIQHHTTGSETEWAQTLQMLDNAMDGVMEDNVVKIRNLEICNVA